jgi:hypothetical protein
MKFSFSTATFGLSCPNPGAALRYLRANGGVHRFTAAPFGLRYRSPLAAPAP